MFWENVGGTKRLCQEIALHRFFASILLHDPEIPPKPAFVFHPPLKRRSDTHSAHRYVGACMFESDSHIYFIRPPTPRHDRDASVRVRVLRSGRQPYSRQSSNQGSYCWTSCALRCSISHLSRVISRRTGGSSKEQSRPPHAQELPVSSPRNCVSAGTHSPTPSARSGSYHNPTHG